MGSQSRMIVALPSIIDMNMYPQKPARMSNCNLVAFPLHERTINGYGCAEDVLKLNLTLQVAWYPGTSSSGTHFLRQGVCCRRIAYILSFSLDPMNITLHK